MSSQVNYLILATSNSLFNVDLLSLSKIIFKLKKKQQILWNFLYSRIPTKDFELAGIRIKLNH